MGVRLPVVVIAALDLPHIDRAPTDKSADAGVVCEVRRLLGKGALRLRSPTRSACTKAKAASTQTGRREKSGYPPEMARARAPDRADRTPAQSAVQRCSRSLH